jgi:putative inorganic carbon (HCO3(-)) transporter
MKARETAWIRGCQRIVDNEWLILALLLPFAIFPNPLLFPLLLIIPLLWVLRKIGYGHFFVTTPLDLAMLLLLVMVLISINVNFDITLSMPKLSGILYGAAVFYATVAATSRSNKKLALGVSILIACGITVAGVSLLGMNWATKYPIFSAVTNVLPNITFFSAAPEGVNPNQIAGILLWIFPVLIAVITINIKKPGYPYRELAGWRASIIIVIGLAAILFVGGVILLTQSRSGYIGLAGGLMLLAMGFLVLFRRRRANAKFVAAILILGPILVAVFYVLWPGIAEAPFDPTNLNDLDFSIDNLQTRLELWSRALFGIGDFPFTGMGIGQFRRVVHLIYPLFFASPETNIAHAHNQFLQAALDLGIPGLIAYLAIWFGIGAMLLQIWHNTTSNMARMLDLGFAAALLGFFFYSLGDTIALGAEPGFIFWLLIGLVTGLHRLTYKQMEAISEDR